MPSIPFYAMPSDLDSVVTHLNDDAEVAFVTADGPGRWRAVERVASVEAGNQVLWHRPGGTLPLVGRSEREPDETIDDPFAGWTERLPSAVPGMPFFASCTCVIYLHVARSQSAGTGVVPMSAFGWIGDRYRGIGHGAPAPTTKWWRRLQRWVAGQGELVPRGGFRQTRPGRVAAFPAALAALRAGADGDLNPPAT